ncbi:ribbon-helix-helix protein, CopG family [Rubrivivax rivuli]|uniref:Uncharacterized protein n=1 Tax=Rubrivivax rivuli TaxID=1862385 RepID=A0A437R9H6_9BURK|nr:ribbon-helix-helix protein, CopG family [Rubrivivax rivuli]RVU43365.1 hypothetical protein EOE66_20695 [Rubrivivax rivuli]
MTSPTKKTARPRRVTAPRSKAAKARVNFRLSEADLLALDAAAEQNHRSRSELIVLGLQRCLADGVWRPTTSPSALQQPDTVSPSPELVALSQVLMAAVMGLDVLYAGKKRTSTAMQEAAATVADARKRLSNLLQDIQCS